MTDPANVSDATPSDPVPAKADATKKTVKKSVLIQVPTELLAQPDVGKLIVSVSEWANGLKPPKKPAFFARAVTRAVMVSAISTPEQGRQALIGLSRDRTLFDLDEAAVALSAAVTAGLEGTSATIKDIAVLLGSIAIGMPTAVGSEHIPLPDFYDDKAIVEVIACYHHSGIAEGCLSRAVDESFGPVTGRFGDWIALAMAELHWSCNSKRGRKHLAGIARGVMDVIVRSNVVDVSVVLPLVLAISTLDAKDDRTVTVTIMAQRKRLADSPVGQRLRHQLEWLVPKDKAPDQMASASAQVLVLVPGLPTAPASTAVTPTDGASADNRVHQRLVDDLRGELASVRSDLSDRDRSLQKLRADAVELMERLEIVSKERDVVRTQHEAVETEIEHMRKAVEDGARSLADEVGRTHRLKAEMTTLRASIDDDLRRQERATRALMARRLFERSVRIGEWIQSVETGKADVRGLCEAWDEFVATLRNEANP